jgi:pimeloyl-ACP methyl ester carboxylesterase
MKRLLVVVPGLDNSSSFWNPLLERLSKEPEWPADSRILRFDHDSGLLSRNSAEALAVNLAEAIQTNLDVYGSVDDIVMMGHSMGALLVRQAYLMGLGSSTNQLLPQEWADRVSRLVLLAGINRGLRLRWYEKLVLTSLRPGRCLLRDLLIGSDFVTNLRLWWIRKLSSRTSRPLVVQVRGDRDPLVEEEDSLDIEGFLEGHQLLVMGAGHEDLVLPNEDREFPEDKYNVLRQAILRPFADSPGSMSIADSSKQIFFVMHGIRASNDDWVADVAGRITDQIAGAYVIGPTFGRFSALRFVIPVLRRKKVRWFQDLYSMELSKNPLANFNYVGHSYGTYLLGRGLSKLSGMQFNRAFLGGSVLPAQWIWMNYGGQVAELRNSRAQLDFPVGILCSALRGIGMKDIGTAGYTGFQIPFDPNSERCFYRGGHGATVEKSARPDILGFLMNGTADATRSDLLPEKERFTRYSAFAPAFFPLFAFFTFSLCAACGFFLGHPPWTHFLLVTLLRTVILWAFLFLIFVAVTAFV